MRGIERGIPTGQPLLCLHGWLDNLATFTPLFPLLEDKFLIRAFDFPGHGQSDPESGSLPYHFIDSLACIDDVLEKFDWKSCVLLGHSMGAGIASLYAAVRPQKIEKVILIDALGPLAAEESDSFDRLKRYLDERKIYANKKTRIFKTKEAMAKVRSLIGPVPLEDARHLVDRGSNAVENGFSFSSDARCRLPSPVRMTEGQISNILAKISCPTLYIEAQPGMNFAKSSNISNRVKLVPSIEHHILSGGHHIHMEKPQEVAKLIRNFVSS